MSKPHLKTRTWPPFLLPESHSTPYFQPFSTSTVSRSARPLTHLDEYGRASMVDVVNKSPTKRVATAQGRIYIPRVAYELITSTYPTKAIQNETASQEEDRSITKVRRKGDVLTVAQLAGIMAAKKTSDLIPLCHPLSLSNIAVTLTPELPRDSADDRYSIICHATASLEGKTGVEMEALTAVSVSLLTVWDMLKAVAGKEMEIGRIFVSHKSGGRSGDFDRKPVPRGNVHEYHD